ncbi:small subunit ribosomal protein S14 [Nocardioides marinisabuli]|uniref:Small ribosomal subunit protein uS14 n=1 Tax=Nocardioides marinisabuli TaxID=419476 RepID=A0A7Y9EXW9_9ACTN|nr:30S ribosomal protein S14 [Nocardioides marinisabuli]NYD55861.1 small subunit ribosomal protein S14 [Nocardioides marinisabuli]
MAKTSKVVANERRRRTVARYAERRARLKEAVRTAATPQEREAAVRALARLPRDASPVRVRNRDQVDGRPRGYVGKVGLSRINLRTLAHRGELPGITTSSW